MGFSKLQQPEFRTLVSAAWLHHCQREGLPKSLPNKKNAAFVDWYQQELFHATGQTSTTDCNAGRDYDLAMAHFEVLAWAGTKWQMRVYSGDVKRMMHSLRAELGDDALRLAGVDEAYLLNALKQGFGTREPWKVDRDDLIVIVGEVKRSVRRSVAHSRHIADERGEALGLWQENGVWRERGPEDGAVKRPAKRERDPEGEPF